MSDDLKQIESDLTQSFEQFRLSQGFDSATPTASMVAAQQFINRIVAYCKRENRKDTRRIALEAQREVLNGPNKAISEALDQGKDTDIIVAALNMGIKLLLADIEAQLKELGSVAEREQV